MPGRETFDGAPPVLRLSRRSFPFVTKAFADSGYAGERPTTATSIDVEIVRKPKGSGRLCRPPKAMGRREVLRLDQPQPASLEGPRGDARFGKSLLRGLRLARAA